jgi:hypothetical protein
MSEDAFRELLRSPLPEPGSAMERRTAAWAWFSMAAVVGALVTGAVLWLGGGGEEQAAPATTTTTSAAIAAEPALPAGYTPIVGGRYGVRPELIFADGANPVLVVSTAVRSDLDPSSVAGFTGGVWSVRSAGGTATAYQREIRLQESLGVFAIEFPAGTAIEPDATLELHQPLPPEAATVVTPIEIRGLPWSGPLDPIAFPHTDGIEIVFDSIDVGAEGGTIVWHIGNRVDATATITPIVVEGDGLLVPAWAEPPRFNQLPQPPAPPPAPGGTVVLRPLGDPIDAATAASLELRLEVTWQYHQRDPIEIPLAGIGTVDGDR